MPLTALKILNPKKATGLFVLACLTVASALYVVFNYYLASVGQEIANGWLQAESVAIQEGNLLSSITKNQRVLLSSQFVRGIKLVDTSTSVALIEIGENYGRVVPSGIEGGQFLNQSVGFLHRRVYYKLMEKPDLTLSFEIQSDFLIRAFLATVASFIGLLSLLFLCIRKIEAKRIEAENRSKILLGEVAARVAHDIRSPLATLNAVLERVEGLPPNSKAMINAAVQRIREIGLGISTHTKMAALEKNGLKTELVLNSGAVEASPLQLLVEEVIESKRVEFPDRAGDIKLFKSTSLCFASLSGSEFSRMLSNLLDNSIEASIAGSPIHLTLTSEKGVAKLTISDQGSGISKEDLRRIGDRGFTRHKPNGTGLGVYYARRAVESWKGTLKYESHPGQGTTALIEIPITSTPTWFAESIEARSFQTIVVVDDDPTVHEIWKQHIAETNSEATIEHFFDAESAMSWAIQNRDQAQKCLLLTDFNLNSASGSGVSVLERFGLSSPAAYMVTNAYNDVSLRKRCVEIGVRILPKPSIPSSNLLMFNQV